jgi:hypothetical protein
MRRQKQALTPPKQEPRRRQRGGLSFFLVFSFMIPPCNAPENAAFTNAAFIL